MVFRSVAIQGDVLVYGRDGEHPDYRSEEEVDPDTRLGLTRGEARCGDMVRHRRLFSLSARRSISFLRRAFDREDAVLNDTQRLKRYLAEEMVEEYEEGRMSRRQMIKTVSQILGVAVVSPALLVSLGCSNPEDDIDEPEATSGPESNPKGVTVEPDDPDIEVREVEVAGEEGVIEAYQSRPRGEGPYGTILLIQENRSLTEHIRDVTRRFAKVGYVGLAMDLLSRSGGTDRFADKAETTTAISGLDREGVISDLKSGVTWLGERPYVQGGRIGS